MKEIYDRCDNVEKIYEETENYGRINDNFRIIR